MKLHLTTLVVCDQSMYHGEAVRAMVWSTHWAGGHLGRARKVQRGWPVAFAFLVVPSAVLGLGVAAVVALSIGLAMFLALAALVFSAALVAGIFGAIGFVTWQIARHAVPGLAAHRSSLPTLGKRPRKGDAGSAYTVESPVDLLRRRYASGDIGQTVFRQQLTDLLKERYVRGDLTLAEFESRVRHLYQDPALRPPAA